MVLLNPHRFEVSGGGGGPPPSFSDPTDVPNLSLWLDASDLSTISENLNSIEQWDDKSPLENHAFQDQGTSQPQSNGDINGLNAIEFNGSSQYFKLPAALNTLCNGANTVFVAFESSTPHSGRLFNGANGGVPLRYGISIEDGNIQCNNKPSNNGAFFSWPNNSNTHVVGFRRNGSVLVPFFNGVEQTPQNDAADLVATVGMFIGVRQNELGNFFNGKIGEIIAYSASISDEDANNVGNYLERWGLNWADI